MLEYQQFIVEKLEKSKPYKAHELLSNPSLVPKAPGLYFWWLESNYAKEIGIESGHTVNGYTLVYHGTGKDLNQRLVKWELADLKGIKIRTRKQATTQDWIDSKGIDTLFNLPGVAQPARTVRSLFNTHWLDYAATEKFLENLVLTFVLVPISADPKDKTAWQKEYHRKIVKKHETKVVRKHAPVLNISQLADKALRKQRIESGKLSKQMTIKFIKDTFGKDINYQSSAAEVKKALENKRASKPSNITNPV